MAIFQILVSDTSEELVTVAVAGAVQVEVSVSVSLQGQEVSESVSVEAVPNMQIVRRSTVAKSVCSLWLSTLTETCIWEVDAVD